MDTINKLKEWLTTMGYDGNIPSNLKPLCNPATALIWEQLMQNTKPKQEIEHIRNNIVINRLKSKNNAYSSPSIYSLRQEAKYPVKEIELWKRKQTLEKQINALNEEVNEMKLKLDGVSNSNKMKYLCLENCNKKIQENEDCLFLLNAKSKQLENQIFQVDEMLTQARNLTPVRSEEQNNSEVLDVLNKCSEKLEKIIGKQHETKSYPNELVEVKTPRNKVCKSRRAFISLEKKSSVFTSTKIANQSKLMPKNLDNSLGLLDEFSAFDTSLDVSSFKDGNISNTCGGYDLAILNDQDLNDIVEETLYKTDRQIVWKSLCSLSEQSKNRMIDFIVQIIQNDKDIGSLNSEKKDKVITKLYATHVDYEIKTMKTNMNVHQLRLRVKDLQCTVHAQLSRNSSNNRFTAMNESLKLQQKEVGLIASVQFMSKFIKDMRESNGNNGSLKIMKDTVMKLEDEITTHLSNVDQKLTVFKETSDLMNQSRNDTSMLVRKLSHFTLDNNWVMPLCINVSTLELSAFEKYPLYFNKSLIIGNKKTLLRDLPLTTIPYYIEYDSNVTFILTTILKNPYSPAENLLLNLIKAKLKLESFQYSKWSSIEYNLKGYSWEKLQNQETYINHTLDELKSLIHNASTGKITHILANTREVTNFWLEMPLKNVVSPKRLFNGHPYYHYDNIFENFYKQL